MSVNETTQLLYAIQKMYPHSKFMEGNTPEDIRLTARLWAGTLADVRQEDAITAARIHHTRSPFPPTASELLAIVAEMHSPELGLAGEQVWAVALNAAHLGRERKATSLAELPDIARKFVERWFIQICNCPSDQLEILRAQFIHAWDNEITRQRERAVLPNDLREKFPGLPLPSLDLNRALCTGYGSSSPSSVNITQPVL